MTLVSEYLENILVECGGFGKFQMLLTGIVLLSKISLTWSLLMMAFAGATPGWRCQSVNKDLNITYGTWNSSTEIKSNVLCKVNTSGSIYACPLPSFSSEMNTIVSEWNLVCDRKWIPATVSTIQMFGVLISGLLSGQLADTVGRKPTYFASLVILTFTNLLAGFSNSWIMFAIMRFGIGIGCGMYVTVYCNYIIELTPTKFRPLQLIISDWAIWAALFALCAWILHDWAHMHFLTGAITAVFLFFWRVLPESFRWLVSHGKLKEAAVIVEDIARMNGKPMPNLDSLQAVLRKDSSLSYGRKYHFIDLCRSQEIIRRTSFLTVAWLTCGFGFYAIYYGVEQLTGNIYINLFLLSVVEVPANLSLWALQNRIGRRWTTASFFAVGFISNICVAVTLLIATDERIRSQIVNGFSIFGKMCISAAWSSLFIFTTELYPTVISNIGSGIQNSMARIGAMLAPQVVLASLDISGLMYFLGATMMIISAGVCLLLPETRGQTIPDTIANVKRKSTNKLSTTEELDILNSIA